MNSLNDLRDVVSPEILERARAVSGQLTSLGIPHALIGGLAVGVHGHVRATRDVDFLVGSEAFASTEPLLSFRDELREVVRIGHTDLMSVPPSHPELTAELALDGSVPVISLPALVLLKLEAGRPRDRDDVRRLMELHPSQLRAVRDYLQARATELVHRLAEALVG